MKMTRSCEASSPPKLAVSGIGAIRPWLTGLSLTLALLWSYWPTCVPLFSDWQRDENYSVGQLVPLAALYLLWQERCRLRAIAVNPSWWGVVVILLAQGARFFGLAFVYESAERYSLVLTIAGLVLLIAGRQIFWRLRWILLFLLLAVPLPGMVHNLISGPLQSLATAGAVFTLELFGVTVVREGHVMVLNHEVSVAVAEACSGLRMLTAFVVVAATLAYVVKRPSWQKAVLVLSSVPVALMCNLARLVVTAVLFMVASSELAERFFHDFAGLTMMPLAVLMLMGELWLMAKLVLEEKDRGGKARRAT